MKRPGGDDKSAADRQRAVDYAARLWRAQQRPGTILVSPSGKTLRPGARTTVTPDTAGRVAWRRDHDAQRSERSTKLAPVLSILEQTTRPLHAVAATERAALRGLRSKGKLDLPGMADAFVKGAKNEDKSTYSNVLHDLGVRNKAVLGIGGFAGDVLGDPLSYLSFGTASVTRQAAMKAAKRATADAVKAGASKKAADRAGRAAARKAIDKAPKNKGLTVGFAGKQSSGRSTAKLARKVRAPLAGERVRGSLPGRLVRHVAPSVRPAGVAEKDFKQVRAAMTRGRAVSSSGEKRARNIAQAVARALPGDDHSKIIDALENRSLAGLSDREAKVAKALALEFDDMYRAEHGRGLVGRKFNEFGYFPRRPVSELEPGGSRKRLGGAQLASSKARTDRRKYAEFRGTDDDVYSKNAPLSLYLRARDSAVKIGRKEVIDTLHRVGGRWHPGVALKDGDAIFKFADDGKKMPVEVDGDELKSLLRGGAPPGRNEYRVLHRDLVKTAEQGVPERMEGLEEIGRIWDRQVQGRIKTVLTVINPQYHATNLYGDLFNAYLSANVVQLARNLGVSTRALTYRARREAAARTLGKQLDPSSKGVKLDGRRVGWDELIKEAEEHGAINQGFIGRDLAEVLDAQGKEAAERLGQGKVAKNTRLTSAIAKNRVAGKVLHPLDTIRDASQYREDAVRLATYLGQRRKGLSPDEAAAHSNRFHFDYGDLTTFERSVLRRVFPFYTFTARNTPLQVKTLFQRPGKYANYQKIREEAAKSLGLSENWQEDLEPWEQRGAPIPIGRRKDGSPMLLYPKLPLMDLGRLTINGQSDYLLSMLTPIIKAPLEQTQNYNFFFREKIDQLLDEKGPNGETVRTLKPAPKWIVDRLPGSFRDALHIREYTDKRTGKVVWGWPAKLDHLIKQTPLSGTATQFGTGVPNTRGQSQELRLFGYVTGLKVAPLEAKTVSERKLGKEYGFLQAKAKAMRAQGDAYDAKGSRTKPYQAVLDRTRAVADKLGVYDNRRKKPSLLSPEAQSVLDGLKGTAGPTLSPEAKSVLEALRP